MTNVLSSSPARDQRCRIHAQKAARDLKSATPLGKSVLELGFAFDDAFIKIKIEQDTIDESSESELADVLYNAIMVAVHADEKGSADEFRH